MRQNWRQLQNIQKSNLYLDILQILGVFFSSFYPNIQKSTDLTHQNWGEIFKKIQKSLESKFVKASRELENKDQRSGGW